MNNEWKTAGEAIKTVEITHEIQLALKVIIADAIERQMNPKFDSINFRALTSWNEYQAGQDFTPDSPFRVCWCPQVPMQPYERSVESLALAGYAIEILAAYDLYLFEKKLKPDYTNAGWVEAWTQEEGWQNWCSEDGDEFGDWWEENKSERPYTNEIDEALVLMLYKYDKFQVENSIKREYFRLGTIRKFVQDYAEKNFG